MACAGEYPFGKYSISALDEAAYNVKKIKNKMRKKSGVGVYVRLKQGQRKEAAGGMERLLYGNAEKTRPPGRRYIFC